MLCQYSWSREFSWNRLSLLMRETVEFSINWTLFHFQGKYTNSQMTEIFANFFDDGSHWLGCVRVSRTFTREERGRNVPIGHCPTHWHTKADSSYRKESQYRLQTGRMPLFPWYLPTRVAMVTTYPCLSGTKLVLRPPPPYIAAPAAITQLVSDMCPFSTRIISQW